MDPFPSAGRWRRQARRRDYIAYYKLKLKWE